MFTETWQPGTACEKEHFLVLILIIAILTCRIDSHFVIKISDFDLSEDVFQRNYYREGEWMERWPNSLSSGWLQRVSVMATSLRKVMWYVSPEAVKKRESAL